MTKLYNELSIPSILLIIESSPLLAQVLIKMYFHSQTKYNT